MSRRRWLAVLILIAAAPALVNAQQDLPLVRQPDVIYLPTPREAVTAMLKLANVGPGDVVYDLGSGDGRIVIDAVKEFGAARGIGVDLDASMIREATGNAERAGVTGRVRFLRQDLFETDLHDASVVVLYLLPWINRQLIPKLRADLKPGSRVISYRFDMGAWKPDQTLIVNGQAVYFWRIR